MHSPHLNPRRSSLSENALAAKYKQRLVERKLSEEEKMLIAIIRDKRDDALIPHLQQVELYI